jgi:hypothetical protein
MWYKNTKLFNIIFVYPITNVYIRIALNMYFNPDFIYFLKAHLIISFHPARFPYIRMPVR